MHLSSISGNPSILTASNPAPRLDQTKDFIDEVINLIQTQPNATEILVVRVKPLRFAEQNGPEKYEAFFKQFKDAMMAPH